jgi:hypothetical protein
MEEAAKLTPVYQRKMAQMVLAGWTFTSNYENQWWVARSPTNHGTLNVGLADAVKESWTRHMRELEDA